MNWLTDEKGKKYFMNKKGLEGKIYRPSIEWFPPRNYGPWFTRIPILHLIVQWVITYSVIYPRLIGKRGRFKPGDKVKYTWMAYIQIYKGQDKMNEIRTVKEVLYSDNSGLQFTNGDSCDCFWVRKSYFWEK